MGFSLSVCMCVVENGDKNMEHFSYLYVILKRTVLL